MRTDKPGGATLQKQLPHWKLRRLPFIKSALIFFQISHDVKVQVPTARAGWSLGPMAATEPTWPSNVLVWAPLATGAAVPNLRLFTKSSFIRQSAKIAHLPPGRLEEVVLRDSWWLQSPGALCPSPDPSAAWMANS